MRGGDRHLNAHDLDGFADTLADGVVFAAPGGIGGQGKGACTEFFGGWLQAFSDAHVEVHDVNFIDDIAVEERTFWGTHDGPLRSATGDIPPTGRSVGTLTDHRAARRIHRFPRWVRRRPVSNP